MLKIGLLVGFCRFRPERGCLSELKRPASHPILSGGRRMAEVKNEKEECPE
jgi:hypothetical protein